MSKTITRVVSQAEARDLILKGVAITAQAVATTLGPLGHIVLIQKEDTAPVTTKDGVSVAKSINLKHPVMRMGSELVKEAASQTNDLAGDHQAHRGRAAGQQAHQVWHRSRGAADRAP